MNAIVMKSLFKKKERKEIKEGNYEI